MEGASLILVKDPPTEKVLQYAMYSCLITFCTTEGKPETLVVSYQVPFSPPKEFTLEQFIKDWDEGKDKGDAFAHVRSLHYHLSMPQLSAVLSI